MVKRGTRAVSRSNMKRIKLINWKSILVALLVTVIAWGSWLYLSSRTNQAETIRKLELKQTELNIKLKELNKTEIEKKQLELQKVDLEKQLQAKKDTATAYAESLQDAPAPIAVYVPAPMPADGYKAFIYRMESGNNPASVNSIGCRGLGQACPGSKLPCGNDYACQDAYFTNYAMTRYGSWEKAYQFWVAHRWW